MESSSGNNGCNINSDANKSHFNRKILKPNRTIFLKPVYVKRTDNSNLKNPQTQFMNYMNSIFPNDKLESFKDSCTQTSKTIIELAKLDGRISPDSLNGSPRNIKANEAQSIDFKDLHNAPNVFSYISKKPQPITSKQADIVEYNFRGYVANNTNQKDNGDIKSINDQFIPGKELLKKQEAMVRKTLKPINKYCVSNANDFSTIVEESISKESFAKELQQIEDTRKMNYKEEYDLIIAEKKHEEICYENEKHYLPMNHIKNKTDECVQVFTNNTPPIVITMVDKKIQKLTKVIKKASLIDQFLSKSQTRYQLNEKNKLNDKWYVIDNTPPQNLTSKSYVEPKVRHCYTSDNKSMQMCALSHMPQQIPKLELDNRSSSNWKEKYASKAFLSKRSNSFMSPTLASARKSVYHDVQNIRNLMGRTRRGRSVSPNNKTKDTRVDKPDIPYSDDSVIIAPVTIENPISVADHVLEEVFNRQNNLKVVESGSSIMASDSSSDNQLYAMLIRMKSTDWHVLAEITEYARTLEEPEILIPYMTNINQKLLELLRSPRSHVCRTSCQVAGHMFEVMKDTRRPEFDDIVNVLLHKTADANKFIRQDANLSLDCMVTHIPTFHAVRSLSAKGPSHKNPLVRTATIRLLICAVVIAGPAELLASTCQENTRKRIIQCLFLFLQDKNVDTRRYAERLYKILCKEDNFEICLRKYLYKEELEIFKTKTLKFLKNNLK